LNIILPLKNKTDLNMRLHKAFRLPFFSIATLIIIVIPYSCSTEDIEHDLWNDPKIPFYKIPEEVYKWIGFKEGSYWVYVDSLTNERFIINGNYVLEEEHRSSWSPICKSGTYCKPTDYGKGYYNMYKYEIITLYLTNKDGTYNNEFSASSGSLIVPNNFGTINIYELDTFCNRDMVIKPKIPVLRLPPIDTVYTGGTCWGPGYLYINHVDYYKNNEINFENIFKVTRVGRKDQDNFEIVYFCENIGLIRVSCPSQVHI
jgi:hypothetical protein